MLEALGVPPQDEELYLALLRRPAVTADQLAEHAGYASSTVRRALHRLQDLGLVTRLPGSPVRLMPAPPDVAVNVLVARRQQELSQAQAAARLLLARLPAERERAPEDLVEIVVGPYAVANRFLQIEQTVTEELLALDLPPYVRSLDQAHAAASDMLTRGVRCRTIYAPETLDMPDRLAEIRQTVAAGEQARTHPRVPTKLAIADRRIAMLPVSLDHPNNQAVVIHGSNLVDALVLLFELLWSLALPLLPAGSVPATGPDPDGRPAAAPLDQAGSTLVALLAAGLNDRAIARQLGVSSRTLSRLLAGLMDTLGTRTRFQTGVYAVARGLVQPDG